jgi:putative DNA primase/helicase
VPDRDEAGRAHAARVASSCHAAGLQVRVVELPDVEEKGDLSDYLA